jgi:hypothetical protein
MEEKIVIPDIMNYNIEIKEDNTMVLTKKKLFDIVIPVGPNDIDVIHHQIEYTKKNIIGYRNIYIISSSKDLKVEGCIVYYENIFPFSMETIKSHFGDISRTGWYLQQLIKLYAGISIPDILERYLVIDSDTYFIRPTKFLDENKRALYNYGSEYHHPYFEHMRILDNNLTKQDIGKSGICHHMFFETKYIKELFGVVEEKHVGNFYDIFLKSVKDIHGSGASEYEIYFNYMLKYHPEKIKIRELKWKNTKDISSIENEDYDYVSYHYYMR